MSDNDDTDGDGDRDAPVAETEGLLDGQTIQLSDDDGNPDEVYQASEQNSDQD